MNTIQKAERLLVDAHHQLLEFAEEIGRGEWAGREAQAALRAYAIGKEIGKATSLLFVSDGDEGPAPPSLNFQ